MIRYLAIYFRTDLTVNNDFKISLRGSNPCTATSRHPLFKV
jgi:hypothetical protein